MRLSGTLIWAAVALLCAVPPWIAMQSPYLASRDMIYASASVGGIAGLALLLIQPLLAAGIMPGLSQIRARRIHQLGGTLLILCVAVHIIGLYLTSPPDMIDALTLQAPTAFSVYGFVALWSILFTLPLLWIRATRRIAPRRWRTIHNLVALVIVGTTVAHAILIEGLMGQTSKLVLCIAVIVATLGATLYVRILKK